MGYLRHNFLLFDGINLLNLAITIESDANQMSTPASLAHQRDVTGGIDIEGASVALLEVAHDG